MSFELTKKDLRSQYYGMSNKEFLKKYKVSTFQLVRALKLASIPLKSELKKKKRLSDLKQRILK